MRHCGVVRSRSKIFVVTVYPQPWRASSLETCSRSSSWTNFVLHRRSQTLARSYEFMRERFRLRCRAKEPSARDAVPEGHSELSKEHLLYWSRFLLPGHLAAAWQYSA